MRIVFACSEAAPWAKTGGLADVAGSLPTALRAQGHRVRLVLPMHRSVRQELARRGLQPAPGPVFESSLGRGQFWRQGPNWFFDAPEFFDREGIYGPEPGSHYGDTRYSDGLQRFALFNQAVAACLPELGGGRVDVLHIHDWQTAILARMVSVPTLLTLHNLAYQGVFPSSEAWQLGGIPFSGGEVNLLREGIAACTAVNTVSPRYAHEVQTPEFGEGLHGLLAERGVSGILNGIDTQEWDPASDRYPTQTFTAGDLSGKAACARALRSDMGLSPSDGPLFGVVSRLAQMKGLDQVVQRTGDLVDAGGQLVVLGSGSPELEQDLSALASRFPSQVAVKIGFNVPLAHRIVAGVDAMLMPSRFEPCGLNQMYAMRYGALPLVTPVGGLADTVQEGVNGFVDWDLGASLERAFAAWGTPAWDRMVQAAMARDASWGESARAYSKLYRSLV